jgi:hypothetical protein
MSGATNRARKPARRVISLISLGVSSLKSATWITSPHVRISAIFG